MHAGSRRPHLGAVLVLVLPFALAQPALAMSGPVPAAGAGQAPALSPTEVARLSAGATERSIVVMRNQHAELSARSAASRASAVEADQRPIRGELAQLHQGATSLHVVNAVAATITRAEAGRLAANPAVQAVVPDRPVLRTPLRRAADVGPAAGPTTGAAPAAPLQQVCPADPAVPLLEPEALQVTRTEFQPGAGQPQAHDLADGTGVRVAFIADGLDVNNPDLQRNGRSIVFDYRDFSGDGLAAPTGAGEAFGDAASIAAQGSQVHDLSTFVSPAHPLPPGCTIRVRGMAPGASLAALKIFGRVGAFDSMVIQAIDWAIEHDHVDVINESFGANPFPDTRNDPVQLANANAVAAGITVVASSGDAGFTNTIGNTASSSGVIGVGATTQLRLYRQLTSFGSQLSAGGWIDDNPSSLSSSGFTQFGPRTIDLVAPGDLGWAICTPNPALYTDCTDGAGRPAAIESFGGTSESSPLVAGEAALVIDAYRRTHHGASPGPALVKRVLLSTAADLGIPADQQGAGLADALAAVQAAMSVRDEHGAPARQGSGLLLSRTSLRSTAAAGSRREFQVDVTNTGAAARRVTAAVRRLSDTPLSTDAGTVVLDPATAPTFADGVGRKSSFVLHQFQVPAGAQRLDADVRWAAQAQPASTVRETLFDPFGRLAMYSLPQGAGSGLGHVDVHDPAPGTWTAVIWCIDNASVYHGDVQFSFATSRFVPFGEVSPASRNLAPGQTGRFEVEVASPEQPGDLAASLVLDSGAGTRATVPIALRSLVPVGESGGSFAGVLLGGNGRSATNEQMLSFQFDVPRGRPALDLALTLRDPGFRLTGFLVDPNGEPLDIQSTGVAGPAGQVTFGSAMQFFQRRPAPGRWAAIVRLAKGVDGPLVPEPFRGRIGFGAGGVEASGVPRSADTVLPWGVPVTATVRVTNRGATTKDFFVDPRLAERGFLPLLVTGGAGVALPLATPPAMVVPTDSDRLVVAAQSTVPIVMSIQPGFGDPKRLGVSVGTAAIAEDADPGVAPGRWVALPEELGPFDPLAGAPPATANVTAVVETRLFDPAAVPSTGDAWRLAVDAAAPYAPLTLAPGASGAITVVLTPAGPPGSVVRGSLEVSTFNPVTASGDQVATIPYAYRVG